MNNQAYQRAQRRVRAKSQFYIHLGIYLAVTALLIVVNLTASPEYLWFKWPLIGWGIGVLFHAASVFVLSERSMVTEKMIEREMRREESSLSEPGVG